MQAQIRNMDIGYSTTSACLQGNLLRDRPNMKIATTQPRQNLWSHRRLISQFAKRSIDLRHKGSYLGVGWSIISPLLLLGLYVLVFGYIFGGSFGILPNESKIDYALGIFMGLSIFHFAAEVMGTSTMAVITNPNLVKRVRFPVEILPLAQVAASFKHLMISLALVIAGAGLFGSGSLAGVIWLPAILLPLTLFLLGISWFLSAMGVFFRDTTQVLPFLTMALMFASAVFYPASRIPSDAWFFLRLNPLLIAIEQARNTALWNLPANAHHLGYLYLVGVLSLITGYLTFMRLKSSFADMI